MQINTRLDQIPVDMAVNVFVTWQVLPGSHKVGRIEHKFVAGQTGADLERVEQLKKVFPLTYMEMEPGERLTVIM